MMLLIGLGFMALGLASGLLLLASSIGWLSVAQTAPLLLVFPVAWGLGTLMAALGMRTGSVAALLKVAGGSMLLVSLAAIAAMVFGSAGVVSMPQGTLALWYVFGVGLVAGCAGLLIPSSPGARS
jgi:hypothetical protein